MAPSPTILLHGATGIGMVIAKMQQAANQHALNMANLQASAALAERSLELKAELLLRCLDYEKAAHDRRVDAILAIFEANKEFLRVHQAALLMRQSQLGDRLVQERAPTAMLQLDVMIRDAEARLRELDVEIGTLSLEAMKLIRSMELRTNPEILHRIDTLRAVGPAIVIDHMSEE
jgi:hypothetical protein